MFVVGRTSATTTANEPDLSTASYTCAVNAHRTFSLAVSVIDRFMVAFYWVVHMAFFRGETLRERTHFLRLGVFATGAPTP